VNQAAVQANNIGSGTLAAAGQLQDGAAGDIVTLGIGASFFMAMAGVILGAIALFKRSKR